MLALSYHSEMRCKTFLPIFLYQQILITCHLRDAFLEIPQEWVKCTLSIGEMELGVDFALVSV